MSRTPVAPTGVTRPGRAAPGKLPAFRPGVRILFVVNVDWFFLSHRLPLALAAHAAGADVIVAAGDTGRGAEIEAAGLRWVPLELSRGGTSVLRELATVLELARLYRSLRPDLVHHVTIKPILYGSCAARLVGGIRVVNALSGLGYVFTGSARAGRLRSLVLPLYRFALGNPDSRTIFQNPDDLEFCVARGLLPRKHAALIRGAGVDCAEFVPHPVPSGRPLVLLPSRMLWDKGVGEFVKAAARLRGRYPDARFALVGPADPDNPNAVPESQLRQWNQEGVVEWWGYRSDMVATLRQAAIVVLPTRYPEGVPRALIEAAAMARPIVTTDTPGCREIVVHGQNGVLVPPGDVTALAVAITDLLDSPARRAAYGRAGRERVERHFALESVVARTMALYHELISGGAPAIETA